MTKAAVETRNDESAQRYEAWVGDERAGFVDYELGEAVITFTHTEVDDAFEGQGVGSSLARGGLDDVRREGSRRVVARCSFIERWIEGHSDYQDLLA